MRNLFAILGLLAFLIAPVGVALTHGPGSMESTSAHHDHGHDHELGGQVQTAVELGQSGSFHDASDHEHQLQAVLPYGGASAPFWRTTAFRDAPPDATGAGRSAMRRPPRPVSA